MKITSQAVPVFRMIDVAKTREFYCEFLDGTVNWEHRFEPDLPLYMEVQIGDFVMHLSEHFGDALPGSSVRVLVEDIDALHKHLLDKEYRHARPGIHDQEWGMREVQITDPTVNKIIFAAPIMKDETS
jgi:uncharacterized glyoxalase superfamily protein PhnB